MTDAINWDAPLHAPTEPGKYVCRNGEVVDVAKDMADRWKDENLLSVWWYWTGALLSSKPSEHDIIGKHVEPPPDEIYQNVYAGAFPSDFHTTRDKADVYSSGHRTHIKRYVLAEIINLSDDTSGAKP